MSRFRIKIAISFGEVIEFHGGGVFVFAAVRTVTSSVVRSRLTLIARGSDAHAQPAILMSAASDSRKVPTVRPVGAEHSDSSSAARTPGKMQAHRTAAPTPNNIAAKLLCRV